VRTIYRARWHTVNDLAEACAAMFERHRVEAFDGVFHVPDVQRYPALFAWDSGYHALALRHLDPVSARRELDTLYRANRLPDGLVSHQRFVPGADDTRAFVESLFGPMFEGDLTPFVDPPSAAYAAARLSLAGDDAGVAESADPLLGAAVAHLRAFAARRTLDGVLPVALHPFETGTEGSAPQQQLVPGPPEASIDRLRELTVSAVEAEMRPERALALGHAFIVCDPTVCGWYLLALEEVADACRARGRSAEAGWAETTAGSVAEAIAAALWWEDAHLFVAYDVVGRRQLRGVGAMGLVPAAARAIADLGISSTVFEHHLRVGSPMWGGRGFAAGTVRPGGGVGAFVQWDGNAVWGATAYWAHLLAVRLAMWDTARTLRAQVEALISAHGFREFYDAESGDPGGAGAESGFTWPALVLEMAATEEG
jgi:hypothetical protein